MVPYKLRGDIGNLDPWGTPEDLGAETLEGTPQLFGRFDHGGLDTPFSAGVYEATRGKFKAPYPFSEHATVLEGEVVLTDSAGNSKTYGPGDSWFIEKGETIIWDIRSDSVRKSFLLRTSD